MASAGSRMSFPGLRHVAHGGSPVAYYNYIIRFLDTQCTIIVLTNHAAFPARASERTRSRKSSLAIDQRIARHSPSVLRSRLAVPGKLQHCGNRDSCLGYNGHRTEWCCCSGLDPFETLSRLGALPIFGNRPTG
jgi:hypothetical protein